MAKKSVVLTAKARGNEVGDVVSVDADRADELIESGLARKPHAGEVKEAKGEK